MMFIPAETKTVWRQRARRGALSKLKSLLEFREMIADYKAEHVLMEAYKEAAEAMLIAPETLRDDMGKIREYSRENLVRWLSSGLSFDHLETANRLAEAAKKTPAQLLNEAIDPGNATGETMTVDELAVYAIGELPHNSRRAVIQMTIMFDRLRKFPTRFKWDEIKTGRFTDWLDLGKEFLS